MVTNFCHKCETYGALRTENRGTHVALMCDNCNSWLKWVGAKEVPMYNELLSRGNPSLDSLVKFKNNLKKAIEDLGITKEEVVKILDKIYC